MANLNILYENILKAWLNVKAIRAEIQGSGLPLVLCFDRDIAALLDAAIEAHIDAYTTFEARGGVYPSDFDTWDKGPRDG